MGKLRFSVIIPVFNKAEFLDSAFSSLLKQMSELDEMILVDDGSVDGSGDICDRYESEFENVHVIHQKNTGVSAARNKGVDSSKGRYLLFIDCDDTVEAGLLTAAEKAMTNQQMMIFGMSFDYYRNGQIERADELSYSENTIYSKSQIIEFINPLFQTNCLSSACNKVFKADVIRENQLYFNQNMYLYEDLDFVLRYLAVLKNDDHVLIERHPYYHYRLQAQQSNVGGRVRDLNKLLRNMDELKKGFDEFGRSLHNTSCSNKLYTEIYLDLLYAHLVNSTNLKDSVQDMVKHFTLQIDEVQLSGIRLEIYNYLQKADTVGLEKFVVRMKRKAAIRKTIKKMIRKR